MDVDVKEEANEEVTFTERVEECLKEVGDANIDVDSVVDAGVSMLSSTVRPKSAKSCRFTCRSLPEIQVGTIMSSGSRLWLEAIHRRLAGRRRVRNPF